MTRCCSSFAKIPTGKRQGSIESSWHWPDDEDKPSKYRCFTHPFPFTISAEGEYTIGVYYDSYGIAELATPIPLSIKLAESPRKSAFVRKTGVSPYKHAARGLRPRPSASTTRAA